MHVYAYAYAYVYVYVYVHVHVHVHVWQRRSWLLSSTSAESKTIFQIVMYCMQCFLKSKYIKSRTFNDKNRWIIKKLLPHPATRGPYSPGDWRCDETWRD